MTHGYGLQMEFLLSGPHDFWEHHSQAESTARTYLKIPAKPLPNTIYQFTSWEDAQAPPKQLHINLAHDTRPYGSQGTYALPLGLRIMRKKWKS
jgi:hypothetical protein